MTNLSEKQLQKVLKHRVSNSNFPVGRRMLLNGDTNCAQHHFGLALRKGSPRTKLKAIIGLLCSITNLDLEDVAGRAGRPRLR